ncbi:hypothetical protein LCGC14_3036620 [marine sediment metagenome]|uniref:Uncharacterized protein n=1 Tax=marine sediment metagenome TaxID=412755 RepID=A0A0F8YYT4_9ZZZZ
MAYTVLARKYRSQTFDDVKRLDVVFEMHTAEYFERDPNVKKRLVDTKEPLYMLDRHDDIPTSMKYPMDIITGLYRQYHTSSLTYLLALAYHSYCTTGKPGRVELYGIHMAAREEYQDQRPAVEYWIGLMEGAGMTVELPDGGVLLTGNGLYGLERYNPICWDMRQRMSALQMGLNDAVTAIKQKELQQARNWGAIKELDHWLLKVQRGEYSGFKRDVQEESTEAAVIESPEEQAAREKEGAL